MTKSRSKTSNRLGAALVTGPPTLWLALFFFLPLLAIVGISFLSRGDYGEIQRPLTFENYQRLAGFGFLGYDLLYPTILMRSVALGAGTAVVCLLAGLPLAFFIARLGRYKTVGLTLVVIPFWTNLLIRTYAWQILLSPDSFVTRALHGLGIGTVDEAMYPGWFALSLGMICDYLPFMVLPLYASVEKIDWTLAEAAMDLGAGRRSVFRHAIWPQILPGALAGTILVLLPAMGQFVIPDLLGGAKTTMLGNAVQQQFTQDRDWPFGSAIATVALLLVLLGVWLYRRKTNGREIDLG